ncbi:MAG: MGDG synthase family glycosyltransferase [Clostridium sp.]
MKKILILTASTGEGHNQAANSISETFSFRGYEVIKKDFLKSSSKFLDELLVRGYEVLASLFPKVYGISYKITDGPLNNKLLSLLFFFTRKKILKLINESNPDVILLTHPYAVCIIGYLKRKGLITPTISIVTDFIAHGTYMDNNINIYITGSNKTSESLTSKGIDPSKVFSYGIPVKDEFLDKVPGLLSTKDPDYFNILLMSGSMGLKNISYVLKELLNNSHKLRITVVCGNNKELKDSLSKEYNSRIKDKKLHILGFSKDVASLMEFSDLIITKPGGLTITEAINKTLPIIIPFCIPGQEMQNTEFLTSNGYALYVDNLLELNLNVDKLIDNPVLLEDMRNKLSKLASTYSKEKIVDIADNLINQ